MSGEIDRPEDMAYMAYSTEPEGSREAHHAALVALMTSHAHAVCWETLHARRMDVVNAALARALGAMGKFRGESKFSTWFHRICLNECYRVAAAEKTIRDREVSLEEVGEQMEAPRMEGPLSRSDILRQAEKILETKEDIRFLHCKLDGLPDTAIGPMFDLTEVGVRVRWHRIRKKLVPLLGGLR